MVVEQTSVRRGAHAAGDVNAPEGVAPQRDGETVAGTQLQLPFTVEGDDTAAVGDGDGLVGAERP
jgi:hypothetical protein